MAMEFLSTFETCRFFSTPKVKELMGKWKSSTSTKTFSTISSRCFFSTCFSFNKSSMSIASSFFPNYVGSCNSPSIIKDIFSYFIVILSSYKVEFESSSTRLKDMLSLYRMSSLVMSLRRFLEDCSFITFSNS